jgi:hypothetical protein
LFTRAEELLKERLPSVTKEVAREAPRPATPAPAVVAKAPTVVTPTVSKSPVSEAPKMVIAMATQVTMEGKIESGPADWELAVRKRLMQLDVDPGLDADS